MSCLCPPKELSAEILDMKEVQEVISADKFTPAQITAKDISSLCDQFSVKLPLSEVSLGNRTVAFHSSDPGTNMIASWQNVNMRPSKKIAPRPASSVAAWGLGSMGGMGAGLSMDPLHAYISAKILGKLDGLTPEYSPGLLFMEPFTDTSVVYMMSGNDKKLTDGTLKLGNTTYLVLDDSCSDVELKNVVIEGGHLVCHGKGCRVTITNVTFKNSCLVTLGGAKTTLKGTNFDNEELHLVSMVAKDAGSRVFMHGGSVTGGENGVLVSGGARLEGSDVTFHNLLDTAVKAETKSSVLVLTGCTISNDISIKKLFNHTRSDAATTGVMLHNKCAATLRKVTLEGADLGLLMHDSTATLTDVTITGSAVKAAEIKGGASLTATGCAFSRTGPSPGMGVFSGLVAHNVGTNAVLDGCTFTENNESAVTIIGGAVVMVSGCRAEGNKGVNGRELPNEATEPTAAFSIIGSGRMIVQDTTVVGKTPACSGRKVKVCGVTLNGVSVTK